MLPIPTPATTPDKLKLLKVGTKVRRIPSAPLANALAFTVEPPGVPVIPTPAPFLTIAAAKFVAVAAVSTPIRKNKPVFNELLAVRVRLDSGLVKMAV